MSNGDSQPQANMTQSEMLRRLLDTAEKHSDALSTIRTTMGTVQDDIKSLAASRDAQVTKSQSHDIALVRQEGDIRVLQEKHAGIAKAIEQLMGLVQDVKDKLNQGPDEKQSLTIPEVMYVRKQMNMLDDDATSRRSAKQQGKFVLYAAALSPIAGFAFIILSHFWH